MNQPRNWRLTELSLASKWTYFYVFLVLSACSAAPFILDAFYLIKFSEILILCLFAVAFNLMYGYGGMVSFGHAAFFGLGAYFCVIFIDKAELSVYTAVLAAFALTAVFAFVIGFFVVKLTYIYLFMFMLALAEITRETIIKWYSMTNGDQGLWIESEVPLLESDLKLFYFTLATVTVSLAILYAIKKSSFGFCLRAIRDNRKRAPYIGIKIHTVQHIALVISGAFSGLAGVLFALQARGADPNMAAFEKSLEPLMAALLGGAHAFWGPMLGMGILKVLELVVSIQVPEYWQFFIGVLFIVLIIFWPRGVVGMLQDLRWVKWIWVSIFQVISFHSRLYWYVKRMLKQ